MLSQHNKRPGAKESNNQPNKQKGSVPMKSLKPGSTFRQTDTRETLSDMDATSHFSAVLDSVSPVTPSVAGVLRAAADTFEERQKEYGNNYREPFALVMKGLQSAANFWPEDMTENDWSRWGLLTQIAYKITRYASQFMSGGHIDSAHDVCVYAAMLEELTHEARQLSKR